MLRIEEVASVKPDPNLTPTSMNKHAQTPTSIHTKSPV
jgi:hypothetical protein